MIGQVKGFVFALALLGFMLLAFRLSLSTNSLAATFVTGALAGAATMFSAWKAGKISNVTMSLWSWGPAIFIFTLFRLSYPIEYEKGLGWSFVFGMLLSLISFAIYVVFRSSDHHERSS